MIRDIQAQIRKLKQERDICILAHSYQAEEITEIADFVGDSYQLSVAAAGVSQRTVLLCGVHFMAETVKILSPEKTVLLSHPDAGCPMAEQASPAQVLQHKRLRPEFAVVAYINTTAALKTVCDVCVTSSTAVKIVRRMDAQKLLFLPDCNLGAYVQAQVPEKEIELWQGMCPVHAAVTVPDCRAAKAAHPDALLLAHPECPPQVLDFADFVGSTAAIVQFAQESGEKEFIIGTELSIAEHLSFACPDKRFYPLTKRLLCPNMKLTTLMDVYRCVTGEGGLEITLDAETIAKARRCIDEMIRLGG